MQASSKHTMQSILHDLQLAAQSATFHASNVHEECKQAASTHGMHEASMGILC
jgi:hypothetical protein